MPSRFAAVLLGLVAWLPVQAVTVAVDAGNPPFMYQVGEKAVGAYPALVSAIFARMHVPVQVSAMPWKRVVAAIDAGSAGAGGIYKNQERLQKYDFSDPILPETIVVYVNKSRPIDFRSIRDLEGRRVGVIRGWYYVDSVAEARRKGLMVAEEVSGDASNFAKLNLGRLDAVLAIEQSGNAMLQTGNYPQVEAAKVPLASTSGHLAFNKSAHQAALLERFNRTMADMRRDGSFERVLNDALKH